jgi:hypothetical protein
MFLLVYNIVDNTTSLSRKKRHNLIAIQNVPVSISVYLPNHCCCSLSFPQNLKLQSQAAAPKKYGHDLSGHQLLMI